MGYDVERFISEINENLLCIICAGVLEDPLMTPDCEHFFCRHCIIKWLAYKRSCPLDCNAIDVQNLRAVPRILRNLLSDLWLYCDYANNGCRHSVKLESLASHLKDCKYNPALPMPCEMNCGLFITRFELQDHNCGRELQKFVEREKQIQAVIDAQQQNLKDINENKWPIQDLEALQRQAEQLKKLIYHMQRNIEKTASWWQGLACTKAKNFPNLWLSCGPLGRNYLNENLQQLGCPFGMAKRYNICTCIKGEEHVCFMATVMDNYANIQVRPLLGRGIALILTCDNIKSRHQIPEPGFAFAFHV